MCSYLGKQPIIKSLPSNTSLDLSKLEHLKFADDRKRKSEIKKFVYGKIENIVGNGENAGNQHFLHYP